MPDLDTLRPEVREDFESFDELVNDGYQRPMGFDKHWSALRAELLRLAKAEFELMLALQDRLGVQDEYAVVAKGWQERAEKAEAELAALKARIAEAPITQVTRMAAIGGGGYEWAGCRVPDEWNAKCVRLVVEE